MTPLLPQQIGRYELLEFLGGGMSQVYRAKDVTLGRTVAVKILTPEGCADDETRERFLQEARLAGNVTHQNVIHIYDYGEADGRPYLVMEFLHGEDLRSLIRDRRAGDVTRKLRIALQIARALEYVHSQKIVHRDVKPDNVRVMASGGVKVMDFGIAKLEGLSRTQAGFVLGTPYYMSPEQVRGGEITHLVDVYSFGILLFELFAGVKPMKVDDVIQIFHFILNEPIDPTPLRAAGTPEDVIRLVERCTLKEPRLRPQSFAVVAREIELMLEPPSSLAETQLLEQPSASSEPEIGFEPQKTPKWLIPAIAVGVLVLAAGLFWALRSRHPESHGAEASAIVPAEMASIPAGQFLAGETRESLMLPAFLIDKEEVAVRDYLKFAKATARRLPDGLDTADPLRPVADVTFDDAAAYAKWDGKRLPTSMEWERAARGTHGVKYPWGADDDPAKARVNVPQKGPWETGEYGADKSPDGVLNMGGNVAEWVDLAQVPSELAIRKFNGMEPPATANEPWFTVRGGSYLMPLEASASWVSQTVPGRFHSPAVGFRCAKSVQ